ncbi:TonB-dependent siderophore receptor [Hyphomicrobium sulfonivorans]|uniref:TonB-dependent siderophore receptor n=1 Tax=Hyphomicrobium sulfonivorans TaxID=121290 RepID=A0A109BJP0_HYPSL|nr:TonB-dependent siderophore receptor [Hyphomicrobium sulfonivorans]KWT70069.1 TonB-dependent siderophore receptor [Hyphomicrobium sulfonivorans]
MFARVSLGTIACVLATSVVLPQWAAAQESGGKAASSEPTTELDALVVDGAKKKKPKAKPKPKQAKSGSVGAAPPPPAATVLPATDNVSPDAAATENSGSYIPAVSTIGGKLALPIKETPRSISVLTRKRLDDENVTSVEEAATRAPGVYVRNQGDLSDGPFFYARGFLMSVSENGVPLDTSYYGSGFDTAIYDRVEIIRGPDGLMQGQGQLGGSINLVRKAPLAQRQVRTELSAGQWDLFRGLIDVSTPLTASGAVRGRFLVQAETRGSFVDYAGTEKLLGFGSLAFDLTDQTTLTVSALSQQSTVNPSFGAMHIRGTNSYTPRRMFLGAGWSEFNYQRNELTAELSHRFNEDWSLNVNVARRDYDDQKRFAFHNPHPNFHQTGTSALLNRATWFEGEHWTGDMHVKGRLNFLGRKHEIVAGANFEDFGHERWIRNAPSVGLWPAGNPDVPYVELSKAASTISDVMQQGLYAQGRFEIMSWLHLHAGARLSNYKSQSRASATGVTTVLFDEDNVFTPYGGVVVDVTRDWAVYASYADIFRPQSITTTDASDATLPPIVGEQYEVGVKGSLFDGRLMPSLALFRASDTGRALRDPLNPGYYIAAGEVLSEGVDMELAARPLPGWEFTGGYTYTDTTFVAGQPAEVGTRFNSFFPKHTFKFWSNYTFADGMLAGTSLGLGVRAYSESSTSFASPYPATVSQPAYAVVDGRLGFKLDERSELSINVTNILDTVYLPYPDVRGFYGEPRRAVAKITTNW